MANETDGQVIYEIRGDDSHLDEDLSSAQRKVEQSAKETGEKRESIERQTSKELKQEKNEVAEYHKKKNDEILKDDKATGEERKKNEQDVVERIKTLLSDAADQNPTLSTLKEITSGISGAQAAALGAGAAAVMVGTQATSSANDMKKAMNGYLAATGKSADETERYQNVLENIYKNNFGDSFEDIADAMAVVNQQMGELSDEKLQQVTEDAFALRDTFGYDIAESIRTAQTLMKNFGLSSDEAFNLIAQGAQSGLDFSGEMLDSINEYSVQFAKAGLDANDMFGIMTKGAKSGAWNLDKIGDAIKEMSIRMVDGSDTTREGLESIGLDADEITAKFAAGGESAKEAFEQTIEALAQVEDPLAQNLAGVALFGTMWEDLGPNVVTQLSDIESEISTTEDAMGALNEVKYDDLSSMLETLTRNVEMLILPIGELLLPLLGQLVENVLPLLTSLLGPLIELFTEILDPIIDMISIALQPLIDIILMVIDVAMVPLMAILNLLGDVFTEIMSGINSTVSKTFDGVLKVLGGIIDFIAGVFTGDWKRAWNGIADIFDGIVSGLSGIFKAPINLIIDGINGFIRGINKIQIPDWVPGVGGKGFDIDLIPRLKKGMSFVPADYYPAFLDYGERVLTQQENQIYTALGGLEGMVQMSHGGGMRPIRIETVVVLKDREIARASAEYTSEQQAWEEL